MLATRSSVYALAAGLSLLSGQALASDKVSELISYDMLGSDLRYFESIAGVARTSYEWNYVYKVDGCNIEVTAPQAHSINRIHIELSDTCQPDLSNALASYAPNADKALTVGNFIDSFGDVNFYANCLIGCGNAYDPSVYVYWAGPRAFDFREVLLEVKQVSNEAIDAAQKWAEIMQNVEGEDWLFNSQYNCTTKYNTQAKELLSPVKVTAITIGYELNTDYACQ